MIDRHKVGFYWMMAALAGGPIVEIVVEETDEEKKERKARGLQKEIERKAKQGVKIFWYGENYVFARTEKLAKKKAFKKGFI